MPSDVVVSVDDARAALAAALTPAWNGTLMLLDAAPELETAPEQVIFLLQRGSLRVSREGNPPTPGQELVSISLDMLPDGGVALREALAGYIEIALSAIGLDAAAVAIQYARCWGREGGFVLAFKPTQGTARLMVAAEGEDLSTALCVGEQAVMAKRPTLH